MAIPARDRLAAVAGKLRRSCSAFWRCQSGVSAVEYGLIVIMIALALIAGASALGGAISDRFQWLADYFANS